MSNIILTINRISKKIKNSSGYSYLYEYFDELVKMLQDSGTLSVSERASLRGLIQDYAADSIYNNYASANWMRYSARCFYCADFLVRFLGDRSYQEGMESLLNTYFKELVDHGVAPIISQETLDKYIDKNSDNPRELYGILIGKANDECGKCRYWQGNDISLARAYTKSVARLIKRYIKVYEDGTMLKEWIPLLNTVRLADLWYKYPDSANYNHTRPRERELIEDCLDEMLDIHLELISEWFWKNPQELINTYSQEELIEILEVTEDDEFEKILRHAVTLPVNDKIKSVLEHFTNDDEPHVVRLARELLQDNVTSDKQCTTENTHPKELRNSRRMKYFEAP